MATTTAPTRTFNKDIRSVNAEKQYERVPITPEQEKLWTETRMALLWNCPAFTYLLYNMMNPDGSKEIAIFTRGVPIAATDGTNIFLNPDTFFKLKLQKRVFVVAHEIMHCIFDHCGLNHMFQLKGVVQYADGKKLKFEGPVMNISTDLVINDALITAKVGEFDSDWLHDPTLVTGFDSSIDAYRKVYKEPPPSGGGKKPDPNAPPQPPGNGAGNSRQPKGGQGRFDEHLAPGTGQGKDPVQATQDRNPGEWKAAMVAAKAQGKMPANLERIFNELLEPQVSWAEKIEAFFARKVGSGSYDWRRPDRRLIVRDIYAPGRSGYGTDTVVVAIDTSGSIGQKELDVFLSEVGGILSDVRPKRLYIVWCDAKVHGYEEVDDMTDLTRIKAKGGGGTDFRPVFDWVKEMGLSPDALVYLTDLYGSFPQRAPSYPVIWARTTDQPIPWGDYVDVPVK